MVIHPIQHLTSEKANTSTAPNIKKAKLALVSEGRCLDRPGTIDHKVQPVAPERFSIDSEMLPAEIHNFLHQATALFQQSPSSERD
jgi:hypothetical protein